MATEEGIHFFLQHRLQQLLRSFSHVSCQGILYLVLLFLVFISLA
jgi:hypothetical protein